MSTSVSGPCLGNAQLMTMSKSTLGQKEDSQRDTKSNSTVCGELTLHISFLVIKIIWSRSVAEFQHLQVYDTTRANFFHFYV